MEHSHPQLDREKLLETAIEILRHSYEIIIIVDNKDIIRFINRATTNDPSEFIGKKTSEIWPEPDRFKNIFKGVRNLKTAHTEENVVGVGGNLSFTRIVPLSGGWLLILSYPYKATTKALSRRELEIKNMSESGMRAKDIANQLHVSIHTVNTHRKNIKKKIR